MRTLSDLPRGAVFVRSLAVALVVLGGTCVAGPGSAQQGQEVDPDMVDLVFEREVFDYPTFERRNPFGALTGDDTGPRFENLLLYGILRSETPGGSVALFGILRGGSPVSGQTYRLREGERLGNSRVLEIRAREVVLEVEEFGLFETRTLQLERALPQPSPPPNDTGVDEGAEGSPSDVDEEDELDMGFDWRRSGSDNINDRRNGNGGWA